MMRIRKIMINVAVFLLGLTAVFAQTEKSAPDTSGASYVYTRQGGPMDSVLLKDWRPESTLVVPHARAARAKFPAVDVHTHTGQCRIRTAADVEAWVRTKDEQNVEFTVVFTGAIGEEFDQVVEIFAAYPKRFQLWCSLDTSNIEDPDYSQRAVAELVRCYNKGARGLGELSDKGSGLQRGKMEPGKRLHVDDPRMDPIWAKCAELGIPVNLHVADHPSCWRPLDHTQERTPPFQNFNQHGTDALSFEEQMIRRDRMLARHPKTNFILCHFSNQGHDTAALGQMLDKYPNAYLDLSARDYEIGRQPRTMPKFLEKYRDRIMFGTDMGRDKAMYEMWWEIMETPNEHLKGRAGWWHYGAELPDHVLKSIYRDTALKVLKMD